MRSVLLLFMSGLQSLHLFNGTIKFGLGFISIHIVGQLNSIRLTDMKLVVAAGIESVLPPTDACGELQAMLFGARGPSASLLVENCTVEVAFDSPKLDRLVACRSMEGAHVDPCADKYTAPV
jgi:hypothetical protein